MSSCVYQKEYICICVCKCIVVYIISIQSISFSTNSLSCRSKQVGVNVEENPQSASIYTHTHSFSLTHNLSIEIYKYYLLSEKVSSRFVVRDRAVTTTTNHVGAGKSSGTCKNLGNHSVSFLLYEMKTTIGFFKFEVYPSSSPPKKN